MNKFTILDFKKEIINFYSTFDTFKPLAFVKHYNDNVSITTSSEVLLKKFCLYPDYDLNDIIDLPNSSDNLSDYLQYFPILDYLEDMDGSITISYRDFFRSDKYDESFQPAIGSNISKVDMDFRNQYFKFRTKDPVIIEMADSYLYSLIKRYFFIRPFRKSASIEKLMEILQSGGLPCGFYYEDDNMEVFDRKVNFLVYYTQGVNNL